MKTNFSRKSTLSSLALLASITTASAEVLIVEQVPQGAVASEKSSYDLGDKPVIAFRDGNLLVESTKASAQFPLASVVKYYFAESSPTQVNDETEVMPFIFTTEEGVQMINARPEMPVALFGVNGQLIKEYKTSAEGSLEINLSNQPQGVYLIKLSNTTIKVIK